MKINDSRETASVMGNLITLAALSLIIGFLMKPVIIDLMEKHGARKARLAQMMHIISEKGLHSDEPVNLGGGAYYFGESSQPAHRALVSFSQKQTDLETVVTLAAADCSGYGRSIEGGIFCDLSRELTITNGYFAVFRTKPKPER